MLSSKSLHTGIHLCPRTNSERGHKPEARPRCPLLSAPRLPLLPRADTLTPAVSTHPGPEPAFDLPAQFLQLDTAAPTQPPPSPEP